MKRSIYSLQLSNNKNYQKNLDKVLYYIDNLQSNAIIVAPEVSLTDYDYDNLEEACHFSEYALNKFQEVVKNQVLILTLLREINGVFVNQAVVLHRGKVVHTQNKYKLFKLGHEDRYLKAGDGKDIVKFTIDNITYGILICFELRFKELWKILEGSDIIVIPSQWGELRKKHLEILSQALAIMNQCYVVVSNSSKDTMAKSSAVYSPLGGVAINDYNELIEAKYDPKEIKFMRRYLSLK